MEDRLEDDDNDLLSSHPTHSSSYTNPFSVSSDFTTHCSQRQPHTPKIFDRFDDSSSSDDDFSFSGIRNPSQDGVVTTAGKKLDYMMKFLDRKLSKGETSLTNNCSSNSENRPLPEFIGKGGGIGIFRLPVRAAVHPDRPPSLEVRPHPLRETQIGCSLRTILCTESQLWGGGENGVRYWELSELYLAGRGEVELTRSGDEMSTPFRESVQTPEVSCMVGDEGKRVVWSGHVDGKIRCWRMDRRSVGNGFKEFLSWQAHRGPVLSMVMSSYGDLWSGTENGIIKIWPWEAIEKVLSLTAEERHMAALVVERSYIDLRSQVTINGVCYMFSSDVKFLLSDHSTAKVWSGGIFSLALWDARTRELLKVFNVDGQAENWVDMSTIQDMTVEDERKMKFVAALKKEKPQAPFSFLQRSRNAILGAADAVRRAAVKGAFGDDNRRIEAMVMAIDGTVWTGCTSGLLVQWDGNGNRLQDFQYHSFAVQCFCTFGSRIWVGYVSGTVQVLDLQGNLLGGWVAHSAPVMRMAVGAGYAFTLASRGGIRGWNITSPGPLDNLIRSELGGKEFLYTRVENLKILAGTWNVGEGRASQDSLISWIGSAASDAGLIVVGLQELEMGAGVLAMSAAKESVGLEGSPVGQWWLDMIGSILDEGSIFERIGSRQLAGLLIAAWVRNDLKANIGDIDAAAVPCGFGRAIGNKGAVGLRMRVYDRIICFVNCHFAAHLEAVNRRNADFEHVYGTMAFTRPSNLFNAATAGISSAVQMLHLTNVCTVTGLISNSESMGKFFSSVGLMLHLSSTGSWEPTLKECLSYPRQIWLYFSAILIIELMEYLMMKQGILFLKDPLIGLERGISSVLKWKLGNVFQGMREAIIRFPPTYKFERHQPGLAGYDAGEKKRIPAWCDRVLYRDCRKSAASECSLDCPVVGSIIQYKACMDVTDSDHKPVCCLFNVDIARVDESVRRQEFRDIIESNGKIRCMLKELCKVPETIVSTNNIMLQDRDRSSILRITNKSGQERALYTIICQGESTIKEDGLASDHCPRGSFGLPRWLEVNPAMGIIEPDHTTEVTVHHDEFHTQEEYVDGAPQNSWCEDTRDREVILVVKIRGSCTIETSCHHIRVRHCFSTKTKRINSKTNASAEVQRNLLPRSNIQQLDSFDVFDQLRNLHTP
ncbi:hypothetical protein Ancab_000242 [Ancistrocladus abbreviatus]